MQGPYSPLDDSLDDPKGTPSLRSRGTYGFKRPGGMRRSGKMAKTIDSAAVRIVGAQAMMRESKPCPHVSEAGCIAEMVLRHQSNFERRDLRIAKRIRFLIDSGEFIAVRRCDEIDAALESWRDALIEMGVIS